MENQTKTKNLHPRVSGPKWFLRLSAMKLPRFPKCVGNPITSAMNNSQSGSDSFLKMRRLSFETADKRSDADAERIVQLEQLVAGLQGYKITFVSIRP